MNHVVQTAGAQLVRFPEVLALVVTDRSGAVLESSGALDAEVAGAVYTVAVGALEQLGEQLGLGPLQRAAITGPASACLIAAQDDAVVAVHLDPKKPLAIAERKLDGVLRR
jgi:predicted regulator of Ras-like GTPase activity (Roadblock/LC7/MglB family)